MPAERHDLTYPASIIDGVTNLSADDADAARLARSLLDAGQGRFLREQLGHHMRCELASLIGSSQPAVGRWEARQRTPRTSAAVALGRYYGDLLFS